MAIATEPIRRVSRQNPCPVCGKTKWCGVTPHFVICMRVPSERQARNGGWIHPLDGARAIDLPPLPPKPAREPAPPERRDAVYRALLEELRLEERHREQLARRGLSDPEALERLGYRSLPLRGRARIVRRVAERLGGPEALEGVPGIFWREGERRSYPTLAGPPGLLIPTRDWEGRVLAFQVRLDEPPRDDPDLKYLWLSSDGRPGGATSGAPLHWARPRRGAGLRLQATPGSLLAELARLYGRHPERPPVLVTEGVLKADLAAEFTGLLTLGIPGVSLAHHAVEALAGEEAPVRPLAALLAFDADAARKEEVRRARDRLGEALLERDVPVLLLKWPERAGKGIDDVLAAGQAEAIRLEPFGYDG